ncbi:MAG: hypothetical protein QG639_322 [Patescibacteria group bacterium]|nr:hypothetical protein [Patescibacteria group bacterium]
MSIDAAEWNYTRAYGERLKPNLFYEEKTGPLKETSYAGRPIIARDTAINGGVYVNIGSKIEAIVVDESRDPAIRKVYEVLRERLKLLEDSGQNVKQHALEEAYALVQEVMPYSSASVDRIWDKMTDGRKIYLAEFIGGGVCRHQALLVGYLLEKLVRDGILGGRPSIDRNYVEGKGGHAWVRYTNSAGVPYIVDAAQNYAGPLDDMNEANNRWFYQRPEDLETPAKPIQEIDDKPTGIFAKIKEFFLGKK